MTYLQGRSSSGKFDIYCMECAGGILDAIGTVLKKLPTPRLRERCRTTDFLRAIHMYLASLEVSDLRAIQHVRLDFRLSASEPMRRWTVLLGENGCGKSTILKAIGLVLAGSEALPDLLGEPDQWIRNGTSSAQVRAVICTADGEERTVELTIKRGDRRDQVIKRNAAGLSELDAALNHADRNYFIAGYGAFRRPPSEYRGKSGGHSFFGRASHLQTLFSPMSDLISLDAWATDLDYVSEGSDRNVIAEALGKLLPGMSFNTIDKRSRQVVMNTQDGVVPLSQLSEGYQAMAAWAGDLLFRMTQVFEDRKKPLTARGVLLIDEMDLHLHPRWKRQLVDFINDAFPNLQIIATTHSPLSVQQCGEGELFVVHRRDGQPTLLPFKGDPSKLRLSDLFLSPLIGLETLDSPKVAALRGQAREIELKAGPTSAADAQQLHTLNIELEGTRPLAVAEAPALEVFIARSQARYEDNPLLRISEARALFGSTNSSFTSEVVSATKKTRSIQSTNSLALAASKKPATAKKPSNAAKRPEGTARKSASKQTAAAKVARKKPTKKN